MDSQSNQRISNPNTSDYGIYLPPFISATTPVNFDAQAFQLINLNAEKEKIRLERKKQASKLSKRRNTLLRKAHELQHDCNVDIHLVIRNRKNNQVWKYSNGYTPPSEDEFVCEPLKC